MKAILEGNQISLSFFHKVSFHKHVKYSTKYKNLDKNPHWDSENFYINPFYYNGKLHLIITPKFLMSAKSKFYFIKKNHFRAVSSHGITDFEILEDLS